MPVCSMISRPTTVFASWNAGRQCMNLTFWFPELVEELACSPGTASADGRARSQTSLASPIETHTSVCTKSTPDTADAASSVMVMLAPVRPAISSRDVDDVLRWMQLVGTREPDVATHQARP